MIRFVGKLAWRFRGIRVYALVGKSGTGKSFRAKLIMQKHSIDLLIDDGLLIKDQKIIAGKSAKREKAYLAAVKTALFTEKEHRRAVRHALERQSILGEDVDLYFPLVALREDRTGSEKQYRKEEKNTPRHPSHTILRTHQKYRTRSLRTDSMACRSCVARPKYS